MTSRILSTLFFGLAFTIASAQQPATSAASPPSYTLHTGVRVVLTDVTVTDSKGNVVHGLPQAAFHITDNGESQAIRTFEEHNTDATQLVGLTAPGPGVFSNDYLKHLPPVLNVIVLDSSHLAMMDQMYLRYEFHQFLKKLPDDEPFAIYVRNADTTVLVQNFTADHALLAAAADKSLPHMQVLGADYPTDPTTSTLEQIARQLSQIPGRKNVLWFAGGNSGYLPSNPRNFLCGGDDCLQRLYDELETTRIAVYPIDARGINGFAARHIIMQEIADATGGQAYFNNNSLDLIAKHIVATDNSFYTFTFTPANFHPDNKWHKIHVSLDIPGYSLSYRSGYFADDNSNPPIPKLLSADGKPSTGGADFTTAPIIFSASVAPAAAAPSSSDDSFLPLKNAGTPPKGSVPYTVRYTLPSEAFLTQDVNGVPSASFDVAVLAFNEDGETVAVKGDQVFAHFPQDDPHQPVKIAQTVDLKPGDLYLYVAVWDAHTGRVGTLQIPASIPAPPKH